MRVNKEIPRRSHGEAVNRRRVLAGYREDVSVTNRRIDQMVHDVQRLAQIGNMLLEQQEEQCRAELEIELIFLQCKIGKITQADQQKRLSELLDTIEKTNSNLYDVLIGDEIRPSRVQEIKNKVIPPIHVVGYHTKR